MYFYSFIIYIRSEVCNYFVIYLFGYFMIYFFSDEDENEEFEDMLNFMRDVFVSIGKI